MPQSSFLPEDYMAQRAERRSSLISLVLFVIVMVGVVGAFFVTNRQWSIVRVEQQRINAEYAEAAKKIEELNQLESQKIKLLEKAEIVQALVERVPRSILIAELVNRMPDSVSMLTFDLKSRLVRIQAPRVSGGKVKSLAKKKKTKAEEATERKIEVPKYDVTLTITCVGPTDVHVSDYLFALNQCDLLREVELKFSKEHVVDGQVMREFEIEMGLERGADVKHFEPLKFSRSMRNPMMGGSEPLGSFDRSMMEVKFDDENEDERR